MVKNQRVIIQKPCILCSVSKGLLSVAIDYSPCSTLRHQDLAHLVAVRQLGIVDAPS
jgi:hypothetical protein